MNATLRQVGGSVMLAVPPALLDLLHLGAGNAVDLRLDDGRLVVEPIVPARYTLNDLLAQYDESRDRVEEADDWAGSVARGNELI